MSDEVLSGVGNPIPPIELNYDSLPAATLDNVTDEIPAHLRSPNIEKWLATLPEPESDPTVMFDELDKTADRIWRDEPDQDFKKRELARLDAAARELDEKKDNRHLRTWLPNQINYLIQMAGSFVDPADSDAPEMVEAIANAIRAGNFSAVYRGLELSSSEEEKRIRELSEQFIRGYIDAAPGEHLRPGDPASFQHEVHPIIIGDHPVVKDRRETLDAWRREHQANFRTREILVKKQLVPTYGTKDKGISVAAVSKDWKQIVRVN